MTPGERRFAIRLEEKLEDDYLCWFDVPIGPKQRHPDYVVFHPSRGFLILEVKDWKLETIQQFDKSTFTLLTDRGRTVVANPLAQARSYALELVVALQRDPALLSPPGHTHAGKLIMPWGCGVVLSNITRANFDLHEMENVIPSHLVICQDEMTESVEAEAFQERLWTMFGGAFPCRLTLPQIDRFRWHVFPELRIPQGAGQFGLFPDPADSPGARIQIPDLIKIMDIQQEQLARSLGEGHRVIHGVAGSGKTMILGFRCLMLARTMHKPILVLCYNKTLAARLKQLIIAQGKEDQIIVRNFHGWCMDMLGAFHVGKPKTQGDSFYADLVTAVIDGVEANAIPRAQYGAVLIDEGHDFEPAWFRLIVQMVDPSTNALLVLYDDAQSIYGGGKKNFSFASVGIEARGRTTILKLNYRNTLEILSTARAFAAELLDARESDEDGAPSLLPESAGRRGDLPELLVFKSLDEEAAMIATRVEDALAQGRSASDIAVIYRSWEIGSAVASRLERTGISFRWAKGQDKRELFDGVPSVKLITMHSSKGLEFPLVFIPGLCALPAKNCTDEDEARLLYVAMTRSLEQLVLSHHRETGFTARVFDAINDVRRKLRAA